MQDVFANNAAFTATSSSGTTSPISGTSETWTISTLGTAWPALTPDQTMSVQDPVLPGEIIRITASTGGGATSITVTRGADGTAVLAHGTGATYVSTAVASALNKMAPVNPGSVNYWGADPTGVEFSDTAFAAAYAALGGDSGQGVVLMGSGTYKLVNFTNKSYQIGLQGPGAFCCKIDSHSVSGDDAYRHYDSSFNEYDAFHEPFYSGQDSGFRVDGTNADTTLTSGVHVGDMMCHRLDDVEAQHFNGTNCKGIWQDNVLGWYEGCTWNIRVYDCTTCVMFDVNSGANGSAGSGGYSSAAYSSLYNIHIEALANQDGVCIRNGVLITGSVMNITGNFSRSTTATNSGAMLRITGNATNNGGPTFSMLEASVFNFGGETDYVGGYDTPHQTIAIDANSQNRFNCIGNMYFNEKWTPTNFVPGASGPQATFLYSGHIYGDSNLAGGSYPAFQVIGGVSFGAGLWGQAGSTVVLYTSTGSGFDLGTLTENITIAISETPSVTETKDISIRYRQASSGGPFSVTYPATSIVKWVGGAPSASTGAGDMDEVRLHCTAGLPWIGQALLNVS